jgi:hypothetical protein
MKANWLICLIILFGCSKKHDPLFGEVNINGKIVGAVSNEPIPNAIVEMYNVVLRSSPLGGRNPVTTTVAARDTTDSFGNFSIQHTANGQYEFELLAHHTDRKYINPRRETIEQVGNHTRNMVCDRSGIAKIFLTNIAPIDTPYGISFRAAESIVLHNFYRDTVLHLKIVGNSLPTSIFYSSSNQPPQEFNVSVNPWDTVVLHHNY